MRTARDLIAAQHGHMTDTIEPDQTMTDVTPQNYTTVAPWVTTAHTGELLEFITQVFGGEELGRVPLENGRIGHAEIRIGNTVVLAFDRQEDWPEMPSLLRIWVADADATMERAVEAGARLVTPAATSAFGQRGGRIRDPFGNIWWVTEQVEIVEPEEGMRRLSLAPYTEAMREAQESFDREMVGFSREVSPPQTPRSRG
jgi:PhnB protein